MYNVSKWSDTLQIFKVCLTILRHCTFQRLTHFKPTFAFNNPWKLKKTSSFFTVLGEIEMEY